MTDSSARQARWRPLLEGREEERAREAVAEIAAALAAAPGGRREGVAVAGGQAGISLFYAYLEADSPGRGYGEESMACLDSSIDALGTSDVGPELYSGFSGVAWAVDHLQGRLLEADDDDPNEQIDAAVRECLAAPWAGDYDLITGLVGFGVYALERLRRPTAAEVVRLVLDHLETLAERDECGLRWFTPPRLLWEGARETAPEGLYNLGVAHGMPGVVGFLAAVCEAGVEVERARRMLAESVLWLLAQQVGWEGSAIFPSVTGPGLKPTPSRLAWCYGDAGIAATLLRAARAAGEPAWEVAARRIALVAARRPMEECGVVDAGLCHGSAGLVQIFNRLWQATGEPEFKAAALRWAGHALDFRKPGEGIGGYLIWEPETPMGEFIWQQRPGVLSGTAGIGLALLAAVSPVEPEWDRLLLTTLAPSAGLEEAAA
jgi:lantibiotic modifying enzyme